ncbi:MAG: GNAT family N-acetyltransferase [Burkholderiales bacterium]|nr:GNAT family N-acetyltransferase [Burkholderiales bacterium]
MSSPSNARTSRSRVHLRQPVAEDQPAFLAAVRASRALHRPWTSAPDTPARFRAYLERMALPAHRAYLVCRNDTNELVGVVNLTNVVLGFFRSGYVGYYAFSGHERQGLMREGLRAVVRHAFGSLKLHRLEANIQPANAASIALVASCGFSKEGFSPRYLKIGGRWRDHERWAILASRAARPILLAGGNPQIAKADGDDPVRAYIAAMPGWKSGIGQRIDTLVVRTVPGVRKAVKWNSPFYGVEGRGWFLGFHTFTNYVKATFFQGTSLRPPPPGGKVREARWIDIREDDFDEAQMTKWIRQAVALPGWGKS